MPTKRSKKIKYQKATVFISSRNEYELDGELLSEARQQLRDEIEEWFPFFEVRINEEWPALTDDPQEASRAAGRDCDIFVGVLVNVGGFSAQNGLTATHQEFAEAADHTRAKMLVFVEEDLTTDKRSKDLNKEYEDLVDEWLSFEDGKVVGFFATGQQLVEQILGGLDALTAKTVSWHAQRFRQKVQSETEAEWELMTFTERHERVKSALNNHAEEDRIRVAGPHNTMRLHRVNDDTADPGTPDRYMLSFTERGTDLPVIVTACPDRFSYPDASRYVGYPFRTAVEVWDGELGPLHFVLVYRTVTDTQVRRHIGNPDIHVSKQDWGFFASDPERFIQIVYLTHCNDPDEVGIHVRDFLVWLDRYKQVDPLLARAATRGEILRARGT
jgi:hypothetical protein